MQYKSGYILESVWAELKKFYKPKSQTDEDVKTALEKELKIKGLLENLTTFDVITTLNLKRPADPNPLLAVANNIITRGTPTLCSTFVETKIAEAIKQTKRQIEYGTIKFPFAETNITGENIFYALHYILPKDLASKEEIYSGDLDSDFEKSFINNLIPNEHSYLKQLFQHQRKRKTLTDTKKKGSVDFCLESQYYIQNTKLNRWKKQVEIKSKFRYIVEIDGAAYHTEQLDDFRDFEINEMPNNISRITEQNLGEDISKLIEKLNNDEFLKIIRKNYNSSLDVTLSTLIFTPIAIARIQKTLIEYLICNYTALQADKKSLKIAIIEQDVPCADLAIKDLSQLFEKLVALENKETWLPEFELKIISSEAFKNSELKTNDSLETLSPSEYLNYDLVIDISIFKREGIFNSDFATTAKNKITIRSSHFTLKETMNTVCSANLIKYREIAKAINNEEHDIDEEAETILEYFIQNIFRKEKFREGQLPILNRALSCKPVIGLLPTGGGKSLTYQLSALLQPGITIVVDPIRALMKNQYDGLLEIGIDKCGFINSILSTSQRTYIQNQELPYGQKQFIFVSPERFVIKDFRTAINSTISNKNYFAYCVIDEVHCVSEWGHDFRTPYLNLGSNAQEICKTKTSEKVVLFGLTATASFDVLTDIERELQIDKADGNAVVRYENTLRDELNYQIIETDIKQIQFSSNKVDVNEVFQIYEKNWREDVGVEKQKQILRSITKGEDKISKFNDKEVLTQLLEITFNQYLPRSQKEKYRSKFSDLNDADKAACLSFIKEMLPKLFIDWKPIFQKNGDEYNYGIIIFCPHKTGDLGVIDVADYLNNNLPDESIGTFVGSSNDGFNQDEISFENLKLFLENKLSIMVATKAFGMGIDKPNIRLTYHINPPSSIESYVQEAGRAGRDKKVSISTIFYNRQLFIKKDDTLTYIGKEPIDNTKTRNDYYNLDKGVLLYFFKNSFRGIDKEIVMINELLDEIYSPLLTNLKIIESYINENLSEDEITLDLPNTDTPTFERTKYIFIKNSTGNIGYVMLNPLATRYGSEIEIYIKKKLEETNLISKNDLRNWLGTINVNGVSKEGIETALSKKKFDESINLRIPFENKFYSKFDKNNSQKRITENTLSPDYVELLLQNKILNAFVNSGDGQKNVFIDIVLKALNENLDFKEFIDCFIMLDDNTRNNLLNDTKLKNSYYSPRSESDTAKAIYRVNSLGIIDTYTIYYQDKYYSVSARKKTVEKHFEILEELFTRYTSQQRAKLLLEQVKEKQNGRSIYKTCTDALTNFVYDLVAKKRFQAIDDMIDLCEISLTEIETPEGGKIDLQRNPTIQDQVIKEEIYYYFNAKYSRMENQAIEKGVYVPASLPDDFNKLNFEELTWKYIKLMATDESGEFRTNVKHLRGSSQKMLRAYPEVPEFMVLKSFSLFILSETTPSLIDEAKKEILTALELQNLEGDALINFIERFISSIKEHYQSAEIEEVFDEILSSAVLNSQLKKLISFNNKFLENYVHN
jgi:superfamily II DNA helicase RecQ/very-short-patch-repair endonuclease